MINDKITKQEGGENSTNLQGQSIVINQGITYQDAKNIAIDVFKSNYLELSTKAANTAKQRAEELVDDFLNEVKKRDPSSLNSVEDPGMQYAIFTAQKEYAKNGDKDLSDMLVDILVDRAAQTERNLKQIVLDESLSIVPKLTLSQLDTLTVVFILKYSRNHNIGNLQQFKQYLEIYLSPFTPLLSKENSLYQHLEFAGCGSISLSSNQIEDIFLSTYKGLFCKGFTNDELTNLSIPIQKILPMIIPCLQDSTRLQLGVIDEDVLEQKAKGLGLNDEERNLLKPLVNNYQMNTTEVKDFILKQGDFVNVLFDVWESSPLKNMTLTSVGIAVATANLRRKTGISVDLGIWIK